VLPAHNRCFYGLHARLDALQAGQERAFDRLRAALAEPKRAVDVFTALFHRSFGDDQISQMSLATGESIACLNYLIGRGEVRSSTDASGVAWYVRAQNA
jgi:hypothetical protein